MNNYGNSYEPLIFCAIFPKGGGGGVTLWIILRPYWIEEIVARNGN